MAMIRCRIPALAAIGILAASRACAAGLVWGNEVIEVAAQPGQRVVHAEFPFRNAGDRVVTITSVETSCRCTTADTSRKSYAPGDRDRLSVDFTVGANVGVVEKTVTVATDGPELAPFILTLRVRIPPPTQAKPPPP
jgi:uncharacterized protein DUF1573